MITVYTSITGGKNKLLDGQNTKGAKFVAFMEEQLEESKTWDVQQAYDKFVSPRRNSRAPKILAHQFIEADYSVWIDGNIQLLVPAQTLVDQWLKDTDIAIFKHHARDCIYEEGELCASYRLDDPVVIRQQLQKYKEEGYGTHKGLAECGVIVRRHTAQVEAFNNYWWSEHCRHSVRDQLSCAYALDKAGIKVSLIEPSVYKHPYFTIGDHLTPRKE